MCAPLSPKSFSSQWCACLHCRRFRSKCHRAWLHIGRPCDQRCVRSVTRSTSYISRSARMAELPAPLPLQQLVLRFPPCSPPIAATFITCAVDPRPCRQWRWVLAVMRREAARPSLRMSFFIWLGGGHRSVRSGHNLYDGCLAHGGGREGLAFVRTGSHSVRSPSLLIHAAGRWMHVASPRCGLHANLCIQAFEECGPSRRCVHRCFVTRLDVSHFGS